MQHVTRKKHKGLHESLIKDPATVSKLFLCLVIYKEEKKPKGAILVPHSSPLCHEYRFHLIKELA